MSDCCKTCGATVVLVPSYMLDGDDGRPTAATMVNGELVAHTTHDCVRHLQQQLAAEKERADRAEALLASPTWLVWSNEHEAWWGSNRRGYYTDIDSAGRYTLEEAIELCGQRSRIQDAIPPEMVQPSPEWIEARQAVLASAKAEGGGKTSSQLAHECGVKPSN